MIRKILGFAVLTFVALVVFKIAMGLLGLLIGFAVTVIVLAAMGYVIYLILRVVSPSTAARVQRMVRGMPGRTV